MIGVMVMSFLSFQALDVSPVIGMLALEQKFVFIGARGFFSKQVRIIWRFDLSVGKIQGRKSEDEKNED